jgi:hypothetical protein
MARLVVLIGSDILPMRSYKERGFIKGLAANVLNLFPAGSVTMDQISLTAIFNMLDSFAKLRDSYLGVGNTPFPTTSIVQTKYDAEKQEVFVRRQDVIERLPSILQQEFPRTYASCMEFGFERSCGIFLAEILPKTGDDGSDWITASNLDLITLTASGIESLVDSCDKNADSRLSWNLFDGKDELDCAFSSASDITRRLMESKIIRMDGLGKDIAKFVMRIIDSNFLTRPFGKVALMEGTKRHVLLAPLLMLKYRSASIGSIYAFAAEMADGDGVKKYEARIREASRSANNNADTSREIHKQETISE